MVFTLLCDHRFGLRFYSRNFVVNILDLCKKGVMTNIIVGSEVWVEDPSVVWIDGEVLKINGEEVEIHTTDGKMVISSLSKIYSKDVEAPAGGVDDMTKLSYLHEPGVLHNLSTRYQLNEIYECLNGEFVRVGPNPKFSPVAGYHCYISKPEPELFLIRVNLKS